jgi:hypothetical protein
MTELLHDDPRNGWSYLENTLENTDECCDESFRSAELG